MTKGNLMRLHSQAKARGQDTAVFSEAMIPPGRKLPTLHNYTHKTVRKRRAAQRDTLKLQFMPRLILLRDTHSGCTKRSVVDAVTWLHDMKDSIRFFPRHR